MSKKIIVPTLGESITEATVSRWLKNIGDQIESDEPLVELETDKVNIEVPSPVSGVLSEIKFENGKTVEVGSELGTVESNKKTNVTKINPPIQLIKEENDSDVANLENDEEKKASDLDSERHLIWSQFVDSIFVGSIFAETPISSSQTIKHTYLMFTFSSRSTTRR